VSDRYIIAWFSHDTFMVGVYAAGYGLVSQPFPVDARRDCVDLRPAYFSAVASGNDVACRHMFRVWLLIAVVICLIGVAAFFVGSTLASISCWAPAIEGP